MYVTTILIKKKRVQCLLNALFHVEIIIIASKATPIIFLVSDFSHLFVLFRKLLVF